MKRNRCLKNFYLSFYGITQVARIIIDHVYNFEIGYDRGTDGIVFIPMAIIGLIVFIIDISMMYFFIKATDKFCSLLYPK